MQIIVIFNEMVMVEVMIVVGNLFFNFSINMKHIIISLFLLLSVVTSLSHADLSELSDPKNQCFNALASQYSEFDFDAYKSQNEFTSSNDGLS
jgi:hypothetical protein